MPSLTFYITGHGFGHASRSIEIINAFIDRHPGTDVFIRSQVAPWLIRRTAHPSVILEPAETDTGIVQIDGLRLDLAATLQRGRAFMASFDQRIAAEVAVLEARDTRLVVADIPPLAIAVGNALDVPTVAIGNFTWDWIYDGYESGRGLAAAIGDVYAGTSLALRLPMHGGFATMPTVTDVPLVARRSNRDRLEVRQALGLPADGRLVLVSFGGHGLIGLNLPALRALDGYQVLLPGDVDEAAMYDKGFRYEDLVHAVDVVVTKPGYGIISECAAHGTALLYTSRGDFREYDVLVEAMPSIVRCSFIDHADLFTGRWQAHLDRVLSLPHPPRPRVDGADIAADYLANLLK